jgi:translocation and assembly module TamB
MLRIDNGGLTASLQGTLGTGTIDLAAKSAGHDLSAIGATIDTTARLERISLIGEREPEITATIAGTFERTSATQWQSKNVKVRGGKVVLPPTSGRALLTAEAPADLFYADRGGAPNAAVFALGGEPPAEPWLVADVDLASTRVEAEDFYNTRGEIDGRLTIQVGKTIGLTGGINIVRGTVGDLFGRLYRAEGKLTFDGTIDPLLDIKLSHPFSEMTLTAELTGRLSKPDPPKFTGSPIYSQDQLAGFFLGGEPGGDPAAQTREAATGAVVSLVSSKVARRVRKVLPGTLSVLRCEPASSAVGASCTAGRWFGDRLFVTGKLRLDARPQLENTGEVQVQYHLPRELLLEGVGGDGNHDGIDLLWRRRW